MADELRLHMREVSFGSTRWHYGWRVDFKFPVWVRVVALLLLISSLTAGTWVNIKWPNAGFAVNLISSLAAFAASVLFVPWLIRRVGRQRRIDDARAQLGEDIVGDIEQVLIDVIAGLSRQLDPAGRLATENSMLRFSDVPGVTEQLRRLLRQDPPEDLSIFERFDGRMASIEARLEQLTSGSDDTTTYHLALLARSKARKSREAASYGTLSDEFADVIERIHAVRQQLLEFVWSARGLTAAPNIYKERGESTVLVAACRWRTWPESSWFRLPPPGWGCSSVGLAVAPAVVRNAASSVTHRKLVCATNERVLLLWTKRLGSPKWEIAHSYGPGDINRVTYTTWHRTFSLHSYGRKQRVSLPLRGQHRDDFKDHVRNLSERTSLVDGTSFPSVESAVSVFRRLWSFPWLVAQLLRGAIVFLASAALLVALPSRWSALLRLLIFMLAHSLAAAPLVARALTAPHFARTRATGRALPVLRCLIDFHIYSALVFGITVGGFVRASRALLTVALRGIGAPRSLEGVLPVNAFPQFLILRRLVALAIGTALVAITLTRGRSDAFILVVLVVCDCGITGAALASASVVGEWADEIWRVLPTVLNDAGQGPGRAEGLQPEPHAHHVPFVPAG